MKKLMNHYNKMILKKYHGSKKITKATNELEIANKLIELFNSKKSFEITLKKHSKSYGLIYQVYFNPETDLYGNHFEKQSASRDFAFQSVFEQVVKYQPDFLLCKSKKKIQDFKKYMNRKNNCLRKLSSKGMK